MWLALLLSVRLAPEAPGQELRQPQLAAYGDGVAVVYGSGRAIYFATIKNGGTVSKPAKVAEAPVLPLGRRRGPRLAVTPRALVVTAVAGTTVATGPHAHGLPADGNLMVWRSLDGGRTWRAGPRLNDVPGSAREGLHSLASAEGKLFAAWLDLRGTGTRLYGASSADDGATWSKNTLIYESPDGTICQCCHPSATLDRDGISVMWRNAWNGRRDMYLSRSRDGGRSFSRAIKLGVGEWEINACPLDGGGLAAAGDGPVAVWRRMSDIYLSRPGEPETRIAAGKDAAIAAGPGGIYLAWTSAKGVVALIPGKREPVTLSPSGGYAHLAATGRAVFAAWEAQGGVEFRELR